MLLHGFSFDTRMWAEQIENDTPDFHGIADVVSQRVPDAATIVMPRVGHMANMEDSSVFNETLMGFLE